MRLLKPSKNTWKSIVNSNFRAVLRDGFFVEKMLKAIKNTQKLVNLLNGREYFSAVSIENINNMC